MAEQKYCTIMEYWFENMSDLEKELYRHSATAKSISKEPQIADTLVHVFDESAPRISVRLDVDERYFSHILCIYVGIVGTPSFVRHSSNFKLINDALSTKGKTLERKFIGGFQGWHVVDNPSACYSLMH